MKWSTMTDLVLDCVSSIVQPRGRVGSDKLKTAHLRYGTPSLNTQKMGTQSKTVYGGK